LDFTTVKLKLYCNESCPKQLLKSMEKIELGQCNVWESQRNHRMILKHHKIILKEIKYLSEKHLLTAAELDLLPVI